MRGARASRVSRLEALDGFRAYAILGVVVIHLFGAAGALSQRVTVGNVLLWGLLGNIIDAFFIISGFLLMVPIVARGGDLGGIRPYAIRRIARLVPAYWVCLVVILVPLLVLPASAWPATIPAPPAPSLADLLVHLGALQMPARIVDPLLPVGFGVDGPLWMISVIVGFYVVLPLVARPYCRHPLLGLALAALITVAWKQASIHLDATVAALSGDQVPAWIMRLILVDQLPGWAFSFALGMTGAWAYVRLLERRDRASIARPAALAAAGAAVVCAICAYLYGRRAVEVAGPIAGSVTRTDTFLALVYSAARAALIGAVALGPLWLRRPFENRAATWLAERSYALYLIHVPVAIYLGSLVLDLPVTGRPLDTVVWLGLITAISLVYAELSLRWVERPARAWALRARAAPREPTAALAGSRSGSQP